MAGRATSPAIWPCRSVPNSWAASTCAAWSPWSGARNGARATSTAWSMPANSLRFVATDHASGEVVGTARLVLSRVPQHLRYTIIGRPDRTLEIQRDWCQAIADAETYDVFRKKLKNPYMLPLPILQSSDFQDRWQEMLEEADAG